MLARMQDIENLPGYRVLQRLRTLEVSILTLDANFHEFRLWVEYLASEDARHNLLPVRNRDQLELALMHVARRLHNFVAAVRSLTDHTTKVHAALNAAGRGFPDYRDELDRQIRTDPLCKFIWDLRNYCLHETLPSIGHVTTVTPDPDTGNQQITNVVVLFRSELIRSERWSAPARKYLHSLPEEIDVLDVASRYRDRAMHFCNWFQDRERQIYAMEFDELHRKQAEYAMIEVELEVDALLAGASPLQKEDAFHVAFNSHDHAELASTPPDPIQRAMKVLELLERKYGRHTIISKELQDKIVTLFARRLNCVVTVFCKTCAQELFAWHSTDESDYEAKIKEAQGVKDAALRHTHQGHDVVVTARTRVLTETQ